MNIDVMHRNFQSTTLLLRGPSCCFVEKEFTVHADSWMSYLPEASQQQVSFTVKMTRRQNSLADLQYRALSVGRSAIVAMNMGSEVGGDARSARFEAFMRNF